jgi:cytochrome c-type biogenesis protein CcmH
MRFLLFGLLLVSWPSLAVIETYEFNSEVDHVRYQKFIEELRCPKCQNQNLAGSNSPIAEDLRREIYRLIDEGKSDTEIIQFMLDRYGDFILYRPRLTGETAILWAAPAIFLLIGAVIVVLLAKRRRVDPAGENRLTEQEQSRLKALLEEDEKDA